MTQDEILQAIAAAMADAPRQSGDPGVTVAELGAALRVCSERVRGQLRPLIAAGTVLADRSSRQAMDGRMASVPVYRLADG